MAGADLAKRRWITRRVVAPLSEMDGFATRLRRNRLLAIVRGDLPKRILDTIDVLVSSGIELIEISLTSKQALTSIRRSAQEFGGDVLIGAGTVLTPGQAAAAKDAGAAFLVTPGGGFPGLADPGIPVIVGAFTPTEVTQALSLNPVAVKLFPASLGGTPYLSALRQPFPEVPFLPVGGIDIDQAPTYLRLGAIAVGIGSPLVGDAASGGDLHALTQRARALRAAVLDDST